MWVRHLNLKTKPHLVYLLYSSKSLVLTLLHSHQSLLFRYSRVICQAFFSRFKVLQKYLSSKIYRHATLLILTSGLLINGNIKQHNVSLIKFKACQYFSHIRSLSQHKPLDRLIGRANKVNLKC